MENATPETVSKKSPKTWPWALLIILIIAGAATWFYFGKGKEDMKFVATVNNEKIPEDIYNARLAQRKGALEEQGVSFSDVAVLDQLKVQVKDEIINETLLLQAARSVNMSVSSDEVSAQFDVIRKRFDTAEAFQAELDKVGFSEKNFRKNIENQLLLQKYIDELLKGKDLSVSDAEITAFYNEIKKQQGDKTPALKDIKDQIELQIRQQKASQIVQPIIAELKAKANIE